MLRILLFCMAALSTCGLNAQPTMTTRFGLVVSDTDYEPIQGATIRSTEGKIFTKTDEFGKFRLQIKRETVTLVISSMGFESKKVHFQSHMSDSILVKLKPLVNQLQEVIVSTGYEEFRLGEATGSFEQIDSELLSRGVGMDIINRLENVSTSLFFDKRNFDLNESGLVRPPITLHGISTLRGTQENEPLIVLDNFPYEGDLSTINPSDIESVTILKDAAATSIWGARAGNGVIVIKSKGLTRGDRNTVSFSSQTTIKAKPDLYAHRTISSKDLIEIERELFNQGYYTGLETARSKPPLPPSVEVLIKMRDGLLSEVSGLKLIESYQQQDIRDDMLRYVYRNALTQQYAINIEKGGSTSSSFFSVGHDRMANTIRNNSDVRTTVRFANNTYLSKWVELQTSMRGALTAQQRPTNLSIEYTNQGYLYPYVKLADDAGSPLSIPLKYRMGFLDTAGAGRLLDWHFKPLDEMNIPATENKKHEFVGNAALKLHLLPWLSADVRYQFQLSGAGNRSMDGVESYAARDRINRGTSLENGNIVYHFPFGGVLRNNNVKSVVHNGRTQLNISKSWLDRHSLRAIAGFEIGQTKYNSHAFTTYGFDPDQLTFPNNVAFGERYPVFANLASTESVPFPINSFAERTNRYVSLFTNASYTFDERYSFSASGRRDASNLFGVNINNKWAPLWSVGVAWNMSKERFVPAALFSNLKLRMSYGFSGNVDNSMSGVATLYYTNNSPSTLVPLPAATLRNPPNPDLRWELVRKLNVGLDFSVFNARLSGSIDYYSKRTEGLIHNFPLDPTTGVTTMDMNVANTRSSGVDISLSGIPLRKSLTWKSTVLFAYNNNWITHSFQSYNGPAVYLMTGALSTLEGTQAFPAYSYRWAGLDPQTGEPRGMLNGEISSDYIALTSREITLEQLVLHGSARPLFFGTLRNDFSYKQFSLSFNLAFKLAYYFRRAGLDYQTLFEKGDGHIDFYNRWQQPGDELLTHVPVLQYPLGQGNTFYQFSEVLMEKGDYVRLRDIRIDYTLGAFPSIPNIKFRAFAMINNIGIVWKANKLGLDPELNGNIPAPRSITLGLNLSIH